MDNLFKKFYIHAITITILILSYSNTSQAEPTLNAKYLSYKIKTNNIDELLAKTKLSNIGNKLQKTNYKISWNFNFTHNENYCKIDSVNTNIDIDLQLPKIDHPGKLPTHENQKFKQIYLNMESNNIHQTKQAISIAHIIENSLLAVPKSSDCNMLSFQANELARSIIQEHTQNNHHHNYY